MPSRKKPSRKKVSRPSPSQKKPARKAKRPSRAPATGVSTEAKEFHQESIVSEVAQLSDEQKRRPDELRINMMRSVVTEPLLTKVQKGEDNQQFDVIVSLNEAYEEKIGGALDVLLKEAIKRGIKFTMVSTYAFARLSKKEILDLAGFVREQLEKEGKSPIYRIWEDADVNISLTKSRVTIKADAAHNAFAAYGEGIVWAVLDSGVQADHSHFTADESPNGPIATLKLTKPLQAMDFTADAGSGHEDEDQLGHGTHVAGIIAGYWKAEPGQDQMVAGTQHRNEKPDGGEPVTRRVPIREISGIAPSCKIVSMKVIADRSTDAQTAGVGKVSWVLRAIEQIQKWNENGKRLTIEAPNVIHGVNMSLGYDFDPRWFGCGQSPLCVEVNRLVSSGVVVVVAAGNGGYSTFLTAQGTSEAYYNGMSIGDPGNAELAITVGSTHREKPHTYGVSYFSSRGPTGDGRIKPDLVAPGERIISCAAGAEVDRYNDEKNPSKVLYVEMSGTSMAAPHVSGAIAAFLSVRREFIGAPDRVKKTFLDSAVDLHRERTFQGVGLLDLIKALQSV